MPEVNSVWDPVAGESIISSTVDVSVAMATPNGLITPIVSSADQRTIPEIAAVLRVSRGGGTVSCVAEMWSQRDLVGGSTPHFTLRCIYPRACWSCSDQFVQLGLF